MSNKDQQSPEDKWQDQSMAVACQFAAALKELHRGNPLPDHPLLTRAINLLMTELWDRGFSQSEIREAFEDAAADLPRYAAGEEVRR